MLNKIMDISDLLEKYGYKVVCKKDNLYNSPFHDVNIPTLYVDIASNSYHCMSTGSKGFCLDLNAFLVSRFGVM